MILGIDEAGRGPWAGPLVVGAVVLGGATIDGLTDSKKLTKKKREQLYEQIQARAAAIGLGWVSADELDEVGISQALRLATKRAVQQIHTPYHEIIIDGTVNFLTETALEAYVTTMAKADLLVPSVSAASIIAKVARDRYMTEQDKIYPGYGFAAHAGYGTARHRAAIDELGVIPLHRLSFAPLQKYRTAGPGAKSALTHLKKHVKELLATDVPGKARTESTEVITTRSIGNSSETVAAEELVRRGHVILERNWKTKYCEIDIISQKSDTIYFTEVKHRRNTKAGDGLDAITAKKLSQMKFAAELYAHSNQINDINLRLIGIATTGDQHSVAKVVVID